MAIAPMKNVTVNIRQKCMVKLPAAILEEHNIGKGSNLSVAYGKNYTAVVILPSNIKVNDRMLERISILVNEPLT